MKNRMAPRFSACLPMRASPANPDRAVTPVATEAGLTVGSQMRRRVRMAISGTPKRYREHPMWSRRP